jgi:hypothetical protein
VNRMLDTIQFLTEGKVVRGFEFQLPWYSVTPTHCSLLLLLLRTKQWLMLQISLLLADKPALRTDLICACRSMISQFAFQGTIALAQG